MSESRPASVRTVVLAGGFGTRVRHLLPGLPKPMAPVCGRPFVEWVVRYYAQAGLRDFILSTGFLSEVIEKHFAQQPVPGVSLSCCAETTPLGTAGGFLNCVESSRASGTGWLVVNGDSLAFSDPRPLLAEVELGRSDAALLGLSVNDAARYGTLDIAPDGRLRAFLEKRPGAGVVNAGVYAFSCRAVSRMPSHRPLSFELDVFPQMAGSGRIAVQTVSAPFLDIGTPATLAEAASFIRTNQTQFLS